MHKKPVIESEFVELGRLAPLVECLSSYNVEPGDDWTNGILSARAIICGSGRIAIRGEEVRHEIDPDELALCRSLAAKANANGGGPLGSEGGGGYHEFYVAAVIGEPVPERIDDTLIRARFGGAILPVATVKVQPLNEDSPWWTEMRQHFGAGLHFEAKRSRQLRDAFVEDALKQARALVDHGRGTEDVSVSSTVEMMLRPLSLIRLLNGPEFRDAAYVEIGHPHEHAPESKWPPSLAGWPCVFPRLFVGLTHAGSLAGIIANVVHT